MNRLRLKTSIDVLRLSTLQACPLRGHDESNDSENHSNFFEFRKVLAEYNDEVAKAIDNAHQNAKYTSPDIRKQLLHILATEVQNYIREETADSKFCIIVDEARDESKREQIALVLRFVDKDGLIGERFFDVVHVKDTSTLRRELCSGLTRHNLNVKNIRGQGYDGGSNMWGEWNGLQALFLPYCPYAYHMHCFAHRLQLALVATSRVGQSCRSIFLKFEFYCECCWGIY